MFRGQKKIKRHLAYLASNESAEIMKKSKQIAVVFLVVLSFFSSMAAACCCSHHQVAVETEVPSCHQKSHENKGEKVSAENNQDKSFNVPCECFRESAPKTFAKSENIKIEKQTANTVSIVSIKFELTAKIVFVENFNFAKPFYLSDSFYRQKSPRAPPII